MPDRHEPNTHLKQFQANSDEYLDLQIELLRDEHAEAVKDGRGREVDQIANELALLVQEREKRNPPEIIEESTLHQTARLSDSHDLQNSQISQRLHGLSLEEVSTDSTLVVLERVITTDSTLEVQREAWDRREWGKLSLGAFLQFALEADKQAVREKQYGPGFELARYCLGYPGFTFLTREQKFNAVLPYLADYTEQQQFNFLYYLGAVRSVPGQNVLEHALTMPLLGASPSVLYDKFLSMTGWAQKERWPDNVILPQDHVSQLLKVSRVTTNNLVHTAILDKHIKLMVEAVPHVLAAEYQFDMDKFPVLKEQQ